VIFADDESLQPQPVRATANHPAARRASRRTS
jgi:hypothetical protein